MEIGDIRPYLGEIAKHLRIIANSVEDNKETGGFLSGDTSYADPVPAGYRYIKVTKTNNTGTVTITLESNTYTLTSQNESFEIPFAGVLPEIHITSADTGEWKWYVTK